MTMTDNDGPTGCMQKADDFRGTWEEAGVPLGAGLVPKYRQGLPHLPGVACAAGAGQVLPRGLPDPNCNAHVIPSLPWSPHPPSTDQRRSLYSNVGLSARKLEGLGSIKVRNELEGRWRLT